MDLDEQAGLRTFAVRVSDDGSPDCRPLWIEQGGAQIAVAQIASSWREEERLGWRLQLTDGSWWLLYHVPELNLWSGVRLASRDGPGGGDGP